MFYIVLSMLQGYNACQKQLSFFSVAIKMQQSLAKFLFNSSHSLGYAQV